MEDRPLLRTWTIYPDYGNAPLVWEWNGIPDSRVGHLVLELLDLEAYFLPDLVEGLRRWYKDWERMEHTSQLCDWQTFYLDGLDLAARMALWVADVGIAIRFSMNSEDLEGGQGPDIWMTPTNTIRYLRAPLDAASGHSLSALWDRIRTDTHQQFN